MWKTKFFYKLIIDGQEVSLLLGSEVGESETEEIFSSLRLLRERIGNDVKLPTNIVSVSADEKRDDNNPANGRYSYLTDTIYLYPPAFRGTHRISGVSNLRGTLFHEAAHKYINGYHALSLQWMDVGGWRRKPDGSTFTVEPDACISDYARTQLEEDFCDSFVAFNFNEPLLREVSEQKNSALKRHFSNANREGDFNVQIQQMNEISFYLPNRFSYVIAKRN